MDPEELQRLREMGFIPDDEAEAAPDGFIADDGSGSRLPDGFIPDEPVDMVPDVVEERITGAPEGRIQPGAEVEVSRMEPGAFLDAEGARGRGESRARRGFTFAKPIAIVGSTEGPQDETPEETALADASRPPRPPQSTEATATEAILRGLVGLAGGPLGIAANVADTGEDSEFSRMARLAVGDETEAAGPVVGRTYTGGEAATAAMLDSALLGFLDEISGHFRGTPEGRYREERDAVRDELATMREQQPTWSTVGDVASVVPHAVAAVATGGASELPTLSSGARALLGRIARATGQGAVMGGASGLGHSEAETASGMAEDTGIGAGVGGGLGMLFGAAGEGARGIGRWAQRQVDEIVPYLRARQAGIRSLEQMRRADLLPPAPPAGAEAEAAENVLGGVRGFVDDLRNLPGGDAFGWHGMSSSSTIADRTRPVHQAATSRIRQVIDDMTRLGDDPASIEEQVRRGLGEPVRGRVHVDVVLQPMRELRNRLDRMPGRGGQARQVERLMERYREMYAVDGMPFNVAQDLKRSLDRLVFAAHQRSAQPVIAPSTPARFDRAVAERSGLMHGMDEAVVRSLGPEDMTSYQQARRQFQVTEPIQAAQRDELMREAVNRQISPTDYLATIGGGAGWGLANRIFRGREHGLRATVTEALAHLARNDPGRLGPWATPLRNALRRGTSALAATHFALMQQNPEYRAHIEGLENETTSSP